MCETLHCWANSVPKVRGNNGNLRDLCRLGSQNQKWKETKEAREGYRQIMALPVEEGRRRNESMQVAGFSGGGETLVVINF